MYNEGASVIVDFQHNCCWRVHFCLSCSLGKNCVRCSRCDYLGVGNKMLYASVKKVEVLLNFHVMKRNCAYKEGSIQFNRKLHKELHMKLELAQTRTKNSNDI